MNNKKEKVALVLSGGGSRGAYEAGAWQALTELGIDIDIVTGTSVGAINGAMVCQGDLELTIDLWRETETHMIFDMPEGSQTIDYAKEIVINKGAGTTGLRELLNKYIDEEKVRSSAVDYGLVVVELASLKPHFLFREDIKKGQLIDYILASSSIFPAVHAYQIDGKEYIDGGYADVLPVEMALNKGADKIFAVKLNAIGILRHEPLKNAGDLTIIESKWNLGSTLVFDVNNSRRIMRLGYLDTMKALGVYDGEYYAFVKNAFSKTDVKMADACAHVFDMNPALLYTKEQFLKNLSSVTSRLGRDFDQTASRFKGPGNKAPSASDIIKDIKNIANGQALCFAIGQNLKEKGADSVFLNRGVIRLIPEQILAARFLNKYGLI